MLHLQRLLYHSPLPPDIVEHVRGRPDHDETWRRLAVNQSATGREIRRRLLATDADLPLEAIAGAAAVDGDDTIVGDALDAMPASRLRTFLPVLGDGIPVAWARQQLARKRVAKTLVAPLARHGGVGWADVEPHLSRTKTDEQLQLLAYTVPDADHPWYLSDDDVAEALGTGAAQTAAQSKSEHYRCRDYARQLFAVRPQLAADVLGCHDADDVALDALGAAAVETPAVGERPQDAVAWASRLLQTGWKTGGLPYNPWLPTYQVRKAMASSSASGRAKTRLIYGGYITAAAGTLTHPYEVAAALDFAEPIPSFQVDPNLPAMTLLAEHASQLTPVAQAHIVQWLYDHDAELETSAWLRQQITQSLAAADDETHPTRIRYAHPRRFPLQPKQPAAFTGLAEALRPAAEVSRDTPTRELGLTPPRTEGNLRLPEDLEATLSTSEHWLNFADAADRFADQPVVAAVVHAHYH